MITHKTGSARAINSNPLQKTTLPSLSLALLAGSLPALSAGEISGNVTLKGSPKPEIKIDLGPTCGKENPNKDALTTRHYVVGTNGGLGNVFVYLKDAKSAPAKAPSPVLDQVGCVYEPYVIGVVVGQPVKIRNSDALMHNVHSSPKFNREFNFAQVLKNAENERSFEKAEVMVPMKCDIHPWMRAYIGVVDHPYFAVTDAAGNFKISGVPDGTYTIVAYHVKTHGAASQGVTKSIEVKGAGKVTQNFTVEIP